MKVVWFPLAIAAFGLAVGVLLNIPDKWDRAVAIKVCGSLPVLRRTDAVPGQISILFPEAA